ncbi:MAG: cytochrome c biogenesis protein CcsA [Coriobacteriia bacterium]|nr:cytochrome c biogenesis protein CcsA [Coriobacteriia bacterium]
MSYASLGSGILYIAFAAAAFSIFALASAGRLAGRAKPQTASAKNLGLAAMLGKGALALCAFCLVVCCSILLYCFISGNNTIKYVAEYRSYSGSPIKWLYLVSGLWAGRSGSLLFWACLLSLFNLSVLWASRKNITAIDFFALAVSQVVLLAFVSVLVFSTQNQPFQPTPESLLDEAGNLVGQAAFWRMNPLLEHWAMAVHPPALFIGYAGLTLPFAYAIAALAVGDDSALWVLKTKRYALVAWLFLGTGIGLGAVWAYVVLGWGGYWAWDPVENASLLSWLIVVALIHSFQVYTQRKAFKRWSLMLACLAFAFVVVGTFITRSGIVSSVHAFESDPVSLAVFGFLVVFPVIAGVAGLYLRRDKFKASSDYAETDDLFTKDTAYYFNNVVMLIVTLLIMYMTLAPALPRPLPFAGLTFSATTFNMLARPMGIVYCLIAALCPMLAWGKADRLAFMQRVRVPALSSLALFAFLTVYFVNRLVPAYDAARAAGGAIAESLLAAGPRWYYLGLTVVGFAVASLLLCNSLVLISRVVGAHARIHRIDSIKAFVAVLNSRAALVGGFFAHFGLAVTLIGLIGSSMFVTEVAGYAGVTGDDGEFSDFTIGNYTLRYVDYGITESTDGRIVNYQVFFDVYLDGQLIARVGPSIDVDQVTEQNRYNAAVVSSFGEDLFVVFNGISMHGALSLDARINPLISFVWWGFGLIMAGTAISAIGNRQAAASKPRPAEEEDFDYLDGPNEKSRPSKEAKKADDD